MGLTGWLRRRRRRSGHGRPRRGGGHLLLLRLLSRCGRLLQLALLVQRVQAFAQFDRFGACRIEIMRALRDLLLQIGNLTPLCPASPAVPRWRGGWTGRGRPCRRGRGDLLLLRLAKLVQRVDVLPQLAGFGVCRIEIVRALRDLLLKIGNLTPQCVLRRLLFRDGGGGWTGRGRPCRSGCGDLLLLRLAKLVQRVDLLSQLAGFGVRRFEILRTLRDLLLKIGNLTPQCILCRLLFRDGGGGRTWRGPADAAAAICCSCVLRSWFSASMSCRNLPVSACAASRSCERCATCCWRSAT